MTASSLCQIHQSKGHHKQCAWQCTPIHVPASCAIMTQLMAFITQASHMLPSIVVLQQMNQILTVCVVCAAAAYAWGT